jgi:O-antigen/teichoic acid export membrane protein
LRAKLLWAYLAHAYVLVLGIALAAFNLRHLGAEAFGLVGFHLMLQSMTPMFDLGLTPVLSREMSRFRAGAMTASEAATRLRTLEVLLGALAIISVLVVWLTSDWIGHRWLSAVALSGDRIAHCVALIGVAVGLRWPAGLQRAVLVGLELQGWVNGLAAVFATLRSAGAVPLLLFVSNLPEDFFLYQVAVAGLELLGHAVVVGRFLPGRGAALPDRRALSEVLPMVGSMATLGAIGVAMSQADKLILSGLLPLREYGYYTLAVTAAGGVLAVVGPLNQVIQPRLTILAQVQDEAGLTSLYRLTTQFMVAGFVSLGGGLAFFAEPILLIWTGDPVAAAAAAPVLFWYGLANTLVALLGLPFMLQFARGRLRLHVVGTLIMLATLVPAIVLAARHGSGVGVGRVILVANLAFLLLWVPLVHRTFLPDLTWRWSFRDTLPTALLLVAALAGGAALLPPGTTSLPTLAWIGAAVLVAAALGITAGDLTRPLVLRWLQHGGRS